MFTGIGTVTSVEYHIHTAARAQQNSVATAPTVTRQAVASGQGVSGIGGNIEPRGVVMGTNV